MAQYQIPDPDDLMQCPYDRTHMKIAKGFQYHLMKCRKNYTGKDFVNCPFNAKHEMPKPELRYHLMTCPDKARLEPELTYAARKESGEKIFKGCTDTPAYEEVNIPDTEDWDGESSGTVRIGVDPSFFNRVKFKDLSGMSRSEKKVMKDYSMTNEDKIKALMKSEQEEDEGQLRLPKTSSIAAMPQQPQVPLKPQPMSSVFAYSVGRGRGAPAQPQPGEAAASNGESFKPVGAYGRGRGLMSEPLPGVGRGMAPVMGGVGRGQVAPPPGFEPKFIVPNITKDTMGGPKLEFADN